jgi:hypothetical protein
MPLEDFNKTLSEFSQAGLDEKINIYVNSEGLSQEQYRELLKLFPLDELDRLEKALQ